MLPDENTRLVERASSLRIPTSRGGSPGPSGSNKLKRPPLIAIPTSQSVRSALIMLMTRWSTHIFQIKVKTIIPVVKIMLQMNLTGRSSDLGFGTNLIGSRKTIRLIFTHTFHIIAQF